jgi:NAD(P)-dependent dehydrogenase (short-subunit alcohol dehydrogenase family)
MQQNPVSLKRTCLVTGGAKRLGREIALAMAHAGWDVVVHYRHSADAAAQTVSLIQQAGRQAVALPADLDAPGGATTLLANAVDALGPISCLINNASRFEFDRPETITDTSLIAHYNSNVVAPVLLTQALYAHAKTFYQPGGDPVAVAIHLLDQKLANPNPDFFAYTLSKAALQESVRLSAMAMAPVMRVAGISPGLTLPSADQTQAEFEMTHAMTPLGASSRAHEVAEAVVWLADARAVTGTVLLVDGGQHLTAQPRDIMLSIR